MNSVLIATLVLKKRHSVSIFKGTPLLKELCYQKNYVTKDLQDLNKVWPTV